MTAFPIDTCSFHFVQAHCSILCEQTAFSKHYKFIMKHIIIDPRGSRPPTRDLPSEKSPPASLPNARETKFHPASAGYEDAKLMFVGTATTILYT